MAEKKISRKPIKKVLKKSAKQDNSLKSQKIKIRIIGIGGGAASILSEMAGQLGKIGFLIADTDKRSFKKKNPKIRTFQFGKELTRGWGTGMNSDIGEKAALEDKEKIKKIFQDTDLVILISCLGGGVSSGASLVFSRILKELKILSLGIFTLPFVFEGEKKMRLAKDSLKDLKKELSGTLVLPNEEILKYSDKKYSLQKSLSLVNQIFIDYFKDLIETIYQPGIINIDFADLRTILKGRSQKLYFGRGIGQSASRIEEAIKQIFQNSFFDKPRKIRKVLFNISAGGDLTLKEVETAAQEVFNLNPMAKIIFGISRNPKLDKKVKITFLGVGDDFKEENKNETVKNNLKEKENPKNNKKEKKAKGKKNSKESKEEESKKKTRLRRSAIEVKKAEEEAKDKEFFGESDWDIPPFLRGK